MLYIHRNVYIHCEFSIQKFSAFSIQNNSIFLANALDYLAIKQIKHFFCGSDDVFDIANSEYTSD